MTWSRPPLRSAIALRIAATLLAVSICPYSSLQAREVSDQEVLESTARKIKADLKGLPEGALTRRISLLGALSELEQDPRAESHRDLKAALQTQSEIEAVLATGTIVKSGLDKSLRQAARFAVYFRDDLRLKRLLQQSQLVFAIESRLTEFLEDDAVGDLSAFLQTLQSSGLWQAVSPIVSPLLEKRVSERVQNLVTQRLGSIELLPAEKLMHRHLLGQGDSPTFEVTLAGELDETLQESLQRMLSQSWKPFLHLKFVPEGEITGDSALRLILRVEDFKAIQQTHTEERQSAIPGRVVELENPEFTKAVEAYEQADRDYKEALERYYEIEYKEYREELEEIREGVILGDYMITDNVSSRMPMHEDGDEGTDVNGRPLLTPGEEMALNDEVNAVTQLLNKDEAPEKPQSEHQARWEKIQRTPATLIEKEPDEPYTYQLVRLEASYGAEVSLELRSPIAQRLREKQEVSLSHKASWTRNVNVHPKDKSVIPETYQSGVVDSEKQLFSAEVSGKCGRALKLAIGKVVKDASESGDLESMGVGLAIALSQSANRRDESGLESALTLYRRMLDPDLNTAELRSTLYNTAAHRGGFAVEVKEKDILESVNPSPKES